MEAEVKEIKREKDEIIRYPILVQHVKYDHIVMFTSLTEGVVLKTGNVTQDEDWDLELGEFGIFIPYTDKSHWVRLYKLTITYIDNQN